MAKNNIEYLKIQVGRIILLNRLQARLSQFELGLKIDLSANQVGRIERAESNPTLETLVKICNYFDIDINNLFVKLNKLEEQSIIAEIKSLKK
ncbi:MULTISPECIES: helix-turn-helix domain-containing protein [Empedobacter]|uniref:XRE family transcriptional regulator n=1 Tax=Empedobacter tilapiae TaxID=2491114 RepID=A0A4Z1BKC8_9FLAO|nr:MULTISPECIES: helix-turn-helix transcriptional regulator [Empedobacter]MBY0067109.1 helix-turn-helix domain-containing protein [Empedobacter falsenii]TGN30227.1 XRE family transcriptional regulator [Empedobacter tilapiae]